MTREFWRRDERYEDDLERSRRRSAYSDRMDEGYEGRQQGTNLATGQRDYYGAEGRSRGGQRVSPGGEYLGARTDRYRNEDYTGQGFGENRGHSDWRTEDRVFGRGEGQTQRGRGPKGYRRSDERIREEVCESLTDDERVDASNFEVTVQDCEVTLSGTVTSRAEKRRAEDIANSIRGVRDVHNRLRVSEGAEQESGESGPMSDMTATQTARH